MDKPEPDRQLILKLKSAEDNLSNKMVEIAQLKKKLFDNLSVIKQDQNALRMMETKKIAITHKVTICEGQIADLKEEKKLFINLVEELRGEIALKESIITKNELAFRKMLTQRDSLQEDVQRWQESYKESRKAANQLQEQVKDTLNSLREREFMIEKLTHENKHLTTEKDVAKQHLLKIRDENRKVNKKYRSLQDQMNADKMELAEKIDDIRILKLDCEHLRKEKCKLVKMIESTPAYRSAIYSLERDLLKERLKTRALEEELERPINIHRWRKLEGIDPSKLELTQKNFFLQKKLLKEMNINHDKNEKLEEAEQKFDQLKQQLASSTETDATIAEKFLKTQNILRKKRASLKLQNTKVNVLVSQNAKMKLKLELAHKKIQELERMQFEQNKKDSFKKSVH